MNILDDTSSSASAGGIDVEPIKNPFEGWDKIKMPKWLDDLIWWAKWILDNWQDVIGQLLLIKLVIDLLTSNWLGVIVDIIAFIVLGAIQIWNAVSDMVDSLKIIGLQFWAWLQKTIVIPIQEGIQWLIDKIVEMFTAGVALINAGIVIVKEFFENLFNDIIDGVSTAWNRIVNILSLVSNWMYSNVIKPVADFFAGLWNSVVNGVSNAIQWVIDKFNAMKNFLAGIVSTIVSLFKNIGTKVADAVSGAFKTVINAVLGAIENILNFPIRSINTLINTINAIPGINIGKLSTFSLPRLKKGTILNAPGKGVPVAGGTAIAGEAGREAYLPLSDDQLLEELGSTIGKYINIYLTNITKLDSRQIAREQKIVNARTAFATNE